MSGAGRSTVANALEDMDWYVVDNLPPQMLKPMAELFSITERALPRLAVVIDARGGELFQDLNEHITSLQSENIDVQVLFLEANDATLIKRFEQVRRPHPLQGDGTISDGIAIERARLLPLLNGWNAAAVNVLLTKRASPSGNGARPASSVCRRSSAPLVGTSGWSTVERA